MAEPSEDIGLRKWPKLEMVARTIAASHGFSPDAVGTRNVLWEAAGIKVMPDKSAVRPVWQFFVPIAENILANIETYDNG